MGLARPMRCVSAALAEKTGRTLLVSYGAREPFDGGLPYPFSVVGGRRSAAPNRQRRDPSRH